MDEKLAEGRGRQMHKRHWYGVMGAFGAVALLCGTACQKYYYSGAVVVPTRTPGVAFVVVSPKPGKNLKDRPLQLSGEAGKLRSESEYILLCDARHKDGMRCSLAPEAAVRRLSYTPAGATADADLELLVGAATCRSRPPDGPSVEAPPAPVGVVPPEEEQTP